MDGTYGWHLWNESAERISVAFSVGVFGLKIKETSI